MAALTTNKSILSWIDEKAALVKPDEIVWIDGSEEQLEKLREEACKSGEMRKLMRIYFRDVCITERLPTMLLVLKTELLFAQRKKKMPVPQTIGWSPAKLMKCSMLSQKTAIRAEQCM